MAPICIPRSGSVDVLESISMQQQPETNTAAADLYTTIPSLFGNVGLIFVKGDLKEVGEETNIYQDPIKFAASVAPSSAAPPVAKEEEGEFDDGDMLENLVEKYGWLGCPVEVYYKEGGGCVYIPY